MTNPHPTEAQLRAKPFAAYGHQIPPVVMAKIAADMLDAARNDGHSPSLPPNPPKGSDEWLQTDVVEAVDDLMGDGVPRAISDLVHELRMNQTAVTRAVRHLTKQGALSIVGKFHNALIYQGVAE